MALVHRDSEAQKELAQAFEAKRRVQERIDAIERGIRTCQDEQRGAEESRKAEQAHARAVLARAKLGALVSKG